MILKMQGVPWSMSKSLVIVTQLNILLAMFLEGDSLWVMDGVIDDHEDVLLAMAVLRQQPYKIHAHPLKWDPNHR